MADIAKPTEERLLVCVSPSSSSARLINAAKRMATGLHAKWFVAFVEQPRMAMLPEAARSRAADNLRLAADLGGEAVTLPGRNVAEEIARFARQRNVTRIIVGKPRRSFGRGILSRNPVDQLMRISGEADVYVIAGEPGEQREAAYVIRPERVPLSDYGAAVLYLVLATLACFAMYPYFHLSNLIMVYLLGVMLTATECGRGPAILSSLLSVLAFDFFFVPPRFSFNVEEAQYIVTFVVMCLVGSRDQPPGCRDAPANHARTFAGAAGGGDARSQPATRQHQRSREHLAGGGTVHLGDFRWRGPGDAAGRETQVARGCGRRVGGDAKGCREPDERGALGLRDWPDGGMGDRELTGDGGSLCPAAGGRYHRRYLGLAPQGSRNVFCCTSK